MYGLLIVFGTLGVGLGIIAFIALREKPKARKEHKVTN